MSGHIYGTKPAYIAVIPSQVHVAANTVHWDLFNADAALVVRVLSIRQLPNVTTAVTGVNFDWLLERTTAAGTGGSTITPWLPNTAGTALDADITCRSAVRGRDAIDRPVRLYDRSEETSAATIDLANKGGLELVPALLQAPPVGTGHGIHLNQISGLRCVQVEQRCRKHRVDHRIHSRIADVPATPISRGWSERSRRSTPLRHSRSIPPTSCGRVSSLPAALALPPSNGSAAECRHLDRHHDQLSRRQGGCSRKASPTMTTFQRSSLALARTSPTTMPELRTARPRCRGRLRCRQRDRVRPSVPGRWHGRRRRRRHRAFGSSRMTARFSIPTRRPRRSSSTGPSSPTPSRRVWRHSHSNMRGCSLPHR